MVVIAVSFTLAQVLADNLDELLIYDVDIEPVAAAGQRDRKRAEAEGAAR